MLIILSFRSENFKINVGCKDVKTTKRFGRTCLVFIVFLLVYLNAFLWGDW